MARQYAAVGKNSRAYKEQQVTGARSFLLIALIFTALNLVLVMLNTMEATFFSIFTPYVLVLYGRLMDFGAMGSNTVTALVIAVVILVVFVLCWLLSKKKSGWLVAGAVLFVLDTAALLFFCYVNNAFSDMLVNILIHAYIVFILVRGCISAVKLKQMTDEGFDDQVASFPEIEF